MVEESSKEKYVKKVDESFPEQCAIIDMDKFIKLKLERLGLENDQGLDIDQDRELMQLIRESSTTFSKKLSLRYGQNPGGSAAFYGEDGASGPCTATFEVLQEGTKGLGYINIGDVDLALRLTKSLHELSNKQNDKELFENESVDTLVATIVKHEMPSGVARGTDPLQTYLRAWFADELSSFGGVIALSYEVTEEVAEQIAKPKKNSEVLIAPSYTDEALEALKKRKPLRVLQMPDISEPVKDSGIDYKRTAGGLLVENRYQTNIWKPEDLECISKKKPTEDDIYTALFAWHVAAHTRSNAIVIATENKAHGIGSGQRSRIDAAMDAIRLSERGYQSKGTFMASDAFMPATDVVKLAAQYGIKGIIFPRGSTADTDVIFMADEMGLVLFDTHERCFLHR